MANIERRMGRRSHYNIIKKTPGKPKALKKHTFAKKNNDFGILKCTFEQEKDLRSDSRGPFFLYVYGGESKYNYLKNRYYDADTGCFITEDPIESENLYTYADNNPLKFYDDDGNKSKKKNKKKRQKAKKIIKQGVVLVGDFIGVNDAVNCVKSPGWKSCGKAVINITPVGKVNKAYKAGKAGVKLLKTARKKVEDTCHCFTAGTKVLTDKGEKKIEDVKYGDKVLSKDDDTGDVAYKSVVGLL